MGAVMDWLRGPPPADGQVDKRKVTMTNVVAVGTDGKGKVHTATMVAVDYVGPDHLGAYVADARTRWQTVDISDQPDAGPAGYHGTTTVPDHLPLPDAGEVYPATRAE